jgi:hypothetical protein
MVLRVTARSVGDDPPHWNLSRRALFCRRAGEDAAVAGDDTMLLSSVHLESILAGGIKLSRSCHQIRFVTLFVG